MRKQAIFLFCVSMFHTSTEKQMEKKKEETEKNETVTEQSATTFSYTIARSILNNRQKGFGIQWTIFEKGFEKTIGQGHEISYDRIKSAARQIRKHVLITPCDQNSQIFHDQPHFKIYVKEEYYQFTESVKARGVIYTLLQLSDEQKRKGVIAISIGNFAWTLCHFGKKFNVPVTVVMPKSSAFEKIEMCKRYIQNSRTRVLVQGRDMPEAHRIALDIAIKEGLFYIDGNAHPNMIIGQATLGLEIAQQMGDKIAAVFLPTTIDDRELAAGVAMAIKGWDSNIKVIIIQTPVTDSLHQIRSQTISLDELSIPVKGYVLPRSCYKKLPEILIDEDVPTDLMLLKPFRNILSQQKECFIEVYLGITLSAYLIYLVIANDLQGNRLVISLFGRSDLDNEFINEIL